MRIPFATFLGIAFILFSGCGGVTEYRADSSGRLHPVAHYRDLWESAVEARIQQEISGAPSPGHNAQMHRQGSGREFQSAWQPYPCALL